MASTPKILVFAGSLRKGSYNKKLARIAAQAARDAGGEVTYLDLTDLPLPIFDGDLEANEGLPPNGRKLKDLMIGSDGILIASPEYNSSVPGVLKNAIDWASRPAPNEPPLAAFTDKIIGLMSASPGALGGLRALVHLRAILGNIGALVIPDQIAIMRANEAFDENEQLKDPKQNAKVAQIAQKVIRIAQKLKA